jgi:predicted RNase H-like nuclease (RuvC/YqgF family)
MNNEYLTIKQAAEQMGVTPQYVYKELNNKYKQFAITIKDKKYLDIKVLEEYKKIEVEQQNNQQSINNEQLFATTLETLNKTVEMLTNQLTIKDNQIESLTKLIDQQQQLQLITSPKQLTNIDKPVEKIGLFARLFNIKK